MAKITFLGAAGTVTGSRHLLTVGGRRILIDCGLFQGTKENREKNWRDFPIPPESVDMVVLTHAHIDHSGYLPRLVREGFRGRVLATVATADLCRILLPDSAHLQEEEAAWANKKGYSKHKPALPLFTTPDAEKALTLFRPVHFGEEVEIADQVRLKFRAAGHILGAAFLDIKSSRGDTPRKLIMGGDLGRARDQILREPDQAYNVDTLVMESTYGDRLHTGGDPAGELARVVQESVERGGVLVMPCFAVGRVQTVLYVLRELEEAGRIPKLPVYVDSPMALQALEVFQQRIADLNLHARQLTIGGTEIFRPQTLHLSATRQQSQAINGVDKGAIILSASGMATGGRILHHLRARLPDARHTVLFIGYQAVGTRGRKLVEGASSLRMFGEEIPVRAHIESIDGFSGHADYQELLAWLLPFNRAPSKTYLVHGEEDARQAMADRIRQQYGWSVQCPQEGESVAVDLGD